MASENPRLVDWILAFPLELLEQCLILHGNHLIQEESEPVLEHISHHGPISGDPGVDLLSHGGVKAPLPPVIQFRKLERVTVSLAVKICDLVFGGEVEDIDWQ